MADRDRLIGELSRTATDHWIAEGQFRIVQQREIIFRIESRGEDCQSAQQQLALLEGTQAALLAHRDQLCEMSAGDAAEIARIQAALLSLLRTGIADASAQLKT